MIASALVLLLVAGGAAFFATTQTDGPDGQAANSDSTVSETNTDAPSQRDSAAAQNQQYVNYSSDYLETTAGTRLLFFHAPWCPQCRDLEADILATELPENVTIVKVDYDSHQDLRQKYGVTVQTTVVKVDDQGNKVKAYIPYDEPTFDNVEANLL